MAEFKISRFRYTWKGTWSGDSITYNKDDVVYYQGSSWVCIRQHSSGIFNDAQTYTPPGESSATPAWTKMAEGRKWASEWITGTRYDPGVIVVSGGNLYLCLTSHVSTTNFVDDLLNWEIFAVGSNFRNTWTASTRYKVGDVIRYNGYTYQCTFEHLSSTISEGIEAGDNLGDEDSSAETWKVSVENYSYVGTYQPNTIYRKNDLVKYSGSILKCTADHTSSGGVLQGLTSIDNAKFETYLPGYNYSATWQSGQYYAVGDVVKKGGVNYVALSNNFNIEPGISSTYPEGSTSVWSGITDGIRYRGVFNPTSNTIYSKGDIVRRGGSLWKSLVDQVASEDSTLVTLDVSNWEPIIPSFNFTGSWGIDNNYNLYDLVYFRGTVYYCNAPHLSNFSNFPGDSGSGFDYWTIVVIGDTDAALTSLGDLITYNLTRYSIQDNGETFVIGDGSTYGVTNISIGTEDQLLTVENNQGDIHYKTWGTFQRVFHVRKNGVDDIVDTQRGKNYFKPWKTVRYALEQADDDYQGTTVILVSTGEYQEVLPLIVPKNTAIVGEELRSVTIRANEPIESLSGDAEYTLDVLTRLGLIVPDITRGIEIIASAGNEEEQDTVITVNSATAAAVGNLISNIIDVINYKVNETGTMPAVVGSNTATTDSNRISAIEALENNRNFIKAEVIAFMEVTNPEYAFDTATYQRNVDKYIDAIQYDLEFTGNYKSVLAGRYYSNEVIGSQLEDMFYVRDTTGIRNVTLKGLNGTLPELTEGEVYRIPTGGAFVSLDPGWGPADERVWINNRSCYIQNVTTFGYGAIGQKIDGLLHNGGNKSIVSNDFTQVISDGIGAWVTNGGRAELVSVFTYYAHIGMFAKDGGIIRATNGNSSYGDFGAVADGLDLDETVRYGYINTRTEQAQVASAFAGEILDYILGLEFENCGQNYTTASYTITSSGVGASAIQEEFRDNAMFECQVLSTGAGFSQYGNQAQFGDTLSITLAASENATEAEILGMRIIIISGEGTGQYGYVYSYNVGTKNCVVYRESDNQPGWDHILPGTPSSTLLTVGTRYRIEPRPSFSEPAFTATELTLPTSNAWANAVYGETSETFTGLTGDLGTGVTEGVIPAAAEFTVVKTGRTYSISLTSGGAGYTIGDVITIDGSDVGGISGEHDIEITVLTTTEDSTNSIVTFHTPGTPSIADSGKFILTPSSGHFGRYSSDAETWTSFDLPTDGNWKCLASGDNKFVAISNGSNNAASSTNGVSWTARTMPSSRNWNGVAYGKPSTVSTGVFVAVAGNLNSAAYSTNGTTWTTSTMPTFGDSTLNEWVDIAFGKNIFVALANSNNIAAIGTWNGTSLTWQGTTMDVVSDSSSKDWISIAYGNRRFVALSSTGDVGYSFDGSNWFAATMPKQDGSTIHNWKQIKYGQGVFFAVGDTGGRLVGADPTIGLTTFAATSYDGIVWTSRTLATQENWGVVAFGNPDITLGDSTLRNSKPTWVIAPSVTSNKLNKVYAGAKVLGRLVIETAGISYIKIWEPGSGYTSDPILSIVDPNKTIDPTIRPRLADGVLAQPTFISTGTSYKTSSTFVTITGDGFADITPVGRYITLDGLSLIPSPGAQLYIGGRDDYFTAVIVGINEQTLADGTIRSTFQVSPRPTLADFFEHDMEVLIREKYSQVRITGHDFLDIGSGNAQETNYPDLYRDYDFTTQPLQEVQNLNGGRVFYTSTDQDGNFRAGEQFAVEQASGIITISADFFDLQGLTELRLAGINVGSTAVIREFSKDPLFLQNSNNIISTQRAIRSYLNSRLNIGGEDLLTPSIIGGTVLVGPNLIDSTAGLTIDIPVLANISGDGAGISGSYLGQIMFYRSFSTKQ